MSEAGGQAAMEVTMEVAMEVTMEVAALLTAIQGEMSRQALQSALMLRNAEHFRKAYLVPAIAAGYLEMTVPAQPTSRLQRYRMTEKGRRWLDSARQPNK